MKLAAYLDLVCQVRLVFLLFSEVDLYILFAKQQVIMHVQLFSQS